MSKTMRQTKRGDYISWNKYFMKLAKLSARRSKDPSTQVGAVIVDNENKIVSIGYNGMPRGCSDDKFCWGKDKTVDNKYLYVVHAEVNAILNSNTSLDNTILYTTLFPCNECAKVIIQSGIKKVIYKKRKKSLSYKASKKMFKSAGVRYQKYVR